jgi:hypothetical protein
MADSEIPYVRHPADVSAPARYAHGPDSYRRPSVPRGKIVEHEWSESRVFPGTTRRYWIYVPAQYTGSEPASLMVFQDGHLYLRPEGDVRASIVMDNLIDRGEMPVTIGVFVDPGEPDNRNHEYDSYPELIRDSPKKPLRIFMLAARHDLDWGPERNWLSANLRVGAALSEADYDFRLVLGDGGHDTNHAGVILPDALRWLWRGASN